MFGCWFGAIWFNVFVAMKTTGNTLLTDETTWNHLLQKGNTFDELLYLIEDRIKKSITNFRSISAVLINYNYIRWVEPQPIRVIDSLQYLYSIKISFFQTNRWLDAMDVAKKLLQRSSSELNCPFVAIRYKFILHAVRTIFICFYVKCSTCS